MYNEAKQKTIILRGDLQKFNAIEWLKNYIPGDTIWEVEFRPHVEKKTMSQRNYWHKLIEIIAPHFGYTKAEMKDVVKEHVLGSQTYLGLDGVEKERLPSSEELKKKEYGELIDATIRLAAEEGIVIPDHRYEEM
jgi:hypothetical protein